MPYNLGLRFREVAAQKGNHPALKYLGGQQWSFDQLDKSSNVIARYLLNLGLKKGDVIALLSDKTFESLSTMMACLKTGIIYTNLDPFSPLSRLSKITDRCAPKYVISDFEKGRLDAEVEAYYEEMTIRPGSATFQEDANKLSDEDLPETESVCGTDPAYIMFTSGSTGFPKGAVMTHANLISFLEWSINITRPEADDCFTNVNPIYFDNSVFDFYTAMFSGTSLAPLTHEVTKQPASLVKAVEELGCTIWFSVPSLLVYLLTTRVISEKNFSKFRLFIFGGEGFPKPKLKQLYEFYGAHARLLNVYGPTECTCICSEYFISEQDFEDMNNLAPLGNMTKNFFYQIVDEEMQPTHRGELLLGGPNVGSGYFNDPERTEKAFVQNPVHANFRDIMYRTGDLVERDEEGLVHFKGRVDNQIKHMGYRIELEEIEAGLNTLAGVKEAAVIYKSFGPGLGQIIGFVASDDALDSKAVIDGVKAIVPDYMVPKRVEVLKALPKNQNGKIDRNALKK